MRTTTIFKRRHVMTAASTSFLLVAPFMASAASAQDEPILQAGITPATVEPGGQLTYASIDPCPQAELTRVQWSYGTEGWNSTEGGASAVDGTAPVAQDASWSVTITAPVEPGRYEIVAECWTDNDDPANPEELPTGRYPETDFVVVADTTEPTAPAPGAPDFQG